jgi:plastocyanin
MRFKLPTGRRLWALASAAVGVSMLAAPSAGLAAGPAPTPTPVPRTITITVSDTGFDKKDYTVYTCSGCSGGYKDQVTVANTGNLVHSATIEPGDPNTLKALIGPNCFPVCQNTGGMGRKFKSSTIFDTGGIGPGQSYTFEFTNGGDFTFTSAPDCLNGNSTPGFDCSPEVIHVKSQQAEVTQGLQGLFAYSTGGGIGIAAADDPQCMSTVPVIVPSDGTVPFCRLPFKRWGRFLGTPEKPVGDTAVTIGDLTGFDPGFLWIRDNSTLTWTNKGTRVHTVTAQGQSQTSDYSHPIDSGGLAPDQTYSYTFCPTGTERYCGRTLTVGSVADLDRYRNSCELSCDASASGKGSSLMNEMIFVCNGLSADVTVGKCTPVKGY